MSMLSKSGSLAVELTQSRMSENNSGVKLKTLSRRASRSYRWSVCLDMSRHVSGLSGLP